MVEESIPGNKLIIQNDRLLNENYRLKERFDKVFNFVPILMAISTIEYGRFINVNWAWLNTMEYDYDEVIGHTSSELGIFLDYESRREVAKLISDNGPIYNQELEFKTRTGKTRIGLFSGDIITVDGENVFLTTALDITEKKQTELQVARLERLRLVGQLSASISHELRNPLSAVYGMLQLLQLNGDLQRYRDEFNLMASELKRANSIIDEFLFLSKDKPINLTMQNLNDIIEKIMPLIKSEAALNRKLVKFDLQQDIPDLFLDEGEIRQLIFNMVHNGLEAMDEMKCITIRTLQRGENVILIFQDEGHGITPEVLIKIGSPFFTTKENGTGLGLATCYDIAHHHNAKISINTSTNGTSFSISFNI